MEKVEDRSKDWYEDHKCPGCGKVLDETVQVDSFIDRTARRCSWCGWTEED